MKKNKTLIVAFLATLTLLASCSKEEEIALAPLRIYLQLPMTLDNATLDHAQATLVNIETMASYSIDNFKQDGNSYVATAVVPEGRYNITATGSIGYDIGASTTSTTMKAEALAVEVTGSNSASSMVTLLLNNYNAEAGMVIEEIFFTSSTFSGTQRPYTDDQYLIITNNSDHLIYADSLAIVESKFQSDMQWELTPNLMKDAITVSWLYLIPGNGTSVPVEAGESLLIALNAKDHTLINPNSIDLSGAQFEFYDVSPNTEFFDEDNPSATNLIKWYSDLWSYTMLANKGSKSYGLVRMHSDYDTFISSNYYKYSYTVNAAWGTYESTGDGYFIPNSWVIDWVNLAIKNEWAWNVASPSLDSGWTYCAETASDKSRYGTSVMRKRDSNGKLIDTNNSTTDFLPRHKPSLAK